MNSNPLPLPLPIYSLLPLPIYSLLCSADVDRALVCLDSLYRRCKDRFRLTVVDDGSLTASDRDRLLGRFEAMKILSREEREDLVGPRLRDKPNCLRYREDHAFGLKLIDAPLLASGAFALCDSDIYFVRDFEGIERRIEGSEDLVFMRDWTSAYSVRFLKRVWGPDRLLIPEYVNAGLLYVGPETHDLDFIEWFLGRDVYRGNFWLIEQTAWAALAGRVRSFSFNDEQVAFPTEERTLPRGLVALHFIRGLRDLLDVPAYIAKVEEAAQHDQGRLVRLKARPAVFHGLVKGTINRLIHIIHTDVPPWASMISGK